MPLWKRPLLLFAWYELLANLYFWFAKICFAVHFAVRTIPTYASDIILYAFSPSFNIFLPTAVRRLQEQGTGALTFVLQLYFFCCKYISLGASESNKNGNVV